MHRLTRDQARRIAVRAQLLDADRPGDVVEVAEQIGPIKIDPTAVIAPSQLTVPWTRIGWSFEAAQLTKAVEEDGLLFEYAGHFYPGTWRPLVRARQGPDRLYGATTAWLEANARFRADVLARLRAEGPLLAAAIDDTSQVAAKDANGWYGSNQVPRMLDVLERLGEVAVVGRVGRMRRWDLAERVHPATPPLGADEAQRMLQVRRLQAAGITRAGTASAGVGTAGEPAEVEGSSRAWRVDPEAIAALDDDPGGRVAILNPYDSMLADRSRLSELFEFDFRSEQFTPKAQRVYGYFAHPILISDRFVGQLDAALDKKRETLVVAAIHEMIPFDDDEREMVHAEIRDLGEWLGVEVAGLG
ncbi:DNA glycosylase AlkZ-like family protein [Microbacterium sp. MC2]